MVVLKDHKYTGDILKSQTLKIFLEDIPQNSRTPVLTHCRRLIKEGYPENTKVLFYNKNSNKWVFKINNLLDASRLTVQENDRWGPRFVKYKEVILPSQINKNAKFTPTCTTKS